MSITQHFPERTPAQDVNASGAPPISGPTGRDPRRFRPAGFWIRAVAFTMDLFILGTLYLFLGLVGRLALHTSLKAAYLETASNEMLHMLLQSYFLLWFLIFFGYFAFFMGYGGQTPAKMYFRMRVVTQDQEPLPWAGALLRVLAYFVSGFLLMGLGFLLVMVHPRKKGVHDLIAGTCVVKEA